MAPIIYFVIMKNADQLLNLVNGYKHFIFILLAIILLRKITLVVYRRRKNLKGKDNFVIGSNNLTMLLLALWIFFLVLHIMGITVREFFTSITIIAAALAIVFRDYILNSLNGMLLMFGDNYRIGDYIEIDSVKGKIIDLTLLNVRLKNDEDNMVIVPNNLIAASRVINYSQNPRHFSTVDFEIRSNNSLSYQTIENTMQAAVKAYSHSIRPDSVMLEVVDFKNDIIHYRYRFGLNSYDHQTSKKIKQQLYKELLVLLEKK